MRTLIAAILFLIPLLSLAGGDSRDVVLVSLSETAENTYTLEYVELEGDSHFTLHLSYDARRYSKHAKFLTRTKFEQAIELLEKQIAGEKVVRLGSFGGGPCIVDRENNIYRSDALDIYEGGRVVFAFCGYR
ncbi:hypothetical protein [Microbulbifer mangrovi]|uniref:hypothetical protein n=1 Tax=Microbulbifer mangrovi TaxID=927787 RepID=UPI0009907863|nr:hypothetical protein [Microbulbifer mangrovi]